jgi:hypothetical protein
VKRQKLDRKEAVEEGCPLMVGSGNVGVRVDLIGIQVAQGLLRSEIRMQASQHSTLNNS